MLCSRSFQPQDESVDLNISCQGEMHRPPAEMYSRSDGIMEFSGYVLVGVLRVVCRFKLLCMSAGTARLKRKLLLRHDLQLQ